MRCIGITKDRKRCQRHASVVFCSQHKLQALTVLFSIPVALGLYAGLYQDLVKPIMESSDRDEGDKISRLHVSSIDISVSPETGLFCPSIFDITALIKVVKPAEVRYRWERSDGWTSPVEIIEVTQPGSISVHHRESYCESIYETQKLRVIAPNEMLSGEVTYSLRCPAEVIEYSLASSGCEEMEKVAHPDMTLGLPTCLVFLNLTDYSLSIIHLDASDQRILHGKLAPRRRSVHVTYKGHRWLLENEDGICIGMYVAPQESIGAIVRSDTEIPSTNKSRRTENVESETR